MSRVLGFSGGRRWEHIADRVSHLVYLDAFVPRNGDTVFGQSRGEGRAKIALGEDWLVTGLVREYDDPAEGAWMAPRRTPHAKGCFTEPVYLARPLEEFEFTRTYVKATAAPETDPGNAAFWAAARHAAASPAWRYREVDTNHKVANNRPVELASLLTEAAGAAN